MDDYKIIVEQEHRTLTMDDRDKRLCRLAMDISRAIIRFQDEKVVEKVKYGSFARRV